MRFATVPKTGIKEDYGAHSIEDKIRFAKVVFWILSIFYPFIPKCTSKYNLEFSVFALHFSHDCASFTFRNSVHIT